LGRPLLARTSFVDGPIAVVVETVTRLVTRCAASDTEPTTRSGIGSAAGSSACSRVGRVPLTGRARHERDEEERSSEEA
jgi:hypothetical protein